MEQEFSFYRLKELMLKKYGTDEQTEHQTACQIVAKFVSFETKKDITLSQIFGVCKQETADAGLTLPILLAFQKLFGFERLEEFFTAPETMPEEFKTDIEYVLMQEADILINNILSLTEIKPEAARKIDFFKEDFVTAYLGTIPQLLKSIVDRSFEQIKDRPLTKTRILNNFFDMCTRRGIKFSNPFYYFMTTSNHYNSIVE